MQSPIAHGQDQAKTVSVSRSSGTGAPAWSSTAPSGAIRAAVVWQSPPARNNQPIGLPGRCRARIEPQPANAMPITALLTTNASSASRQDQPACTHSTTAVTTITAASAPSAFGSTRSGFGCRVRSMGLVSAVSAPEVSRTASRFTRATSRTPPTTHPSDRVWIGRTIEEPADGAGTTKLEVSK